MTGQVGRIWAPGPVSAQELAALAERLAGEGALGERVWWFGWGEGALQLPTAFQAGALAGLQGLSGWEVVHVFGERAELRAWRQGGKWRMAWMAEGPAEEQPKLPASLAERCREEAVAYPYVRPARRLLIGQPMDLAGSGGERRAAWGEVRYRDMSGLREAVERDREGGDEEYRLAMGVYAYLDSRYRMRAVRRARLEWIGTRQLWIDTGQTSAVRGEMADAIRR